MSSPRAYREPSPKERHTAFRFKLRLLREQSDKSFRNAGAQRFARNTCLHFVKDALERKQHDPTVKVPWSAFDCIKAFNAWKKSSAAGIDALGSPGLPWRHEVHAQVFEEGAVDLATALKNFSDSKRGVRVGQPVRFPVFKKKHQSPPSFRLRNKHAKGSAPAIRFIDARTLRLPALGEARVVGSTRKLRRLLHVGDNGASRGKITAATISYSDKS